MAERVQIAAELSISGKQHEDLLKHIRDRLDFCKRARDPMVNHFEIIDRQMAGHIVRTLEDEQRERDNQRGKKVKPIDQNLQLVATQLDEATTYISSILFPDGGTYGAVTHKEQQELAQGMARLMNNHSRKFYHYSAACKAIYDMLSKNFGGVVPLWESIKGPKPAEAGFGGLTFKDDVLFEGNNLRWLDPYNTLWDITVPLTEVYRRGEFFATVEAESKFSIDRMAMRNEIFGVDEVHAIAGDPQLSYWRARPDLRNREDISGETVDWRFILSAGMNQDVGIAYERVTFYCWIIPDNFGLSEEDGAYELWRFTMLNGSRIVEASKIDAAHGMLPICGAMPCDTGFGLQDPSFSDKLIPLQHFSSFLLNTHQDAARRALYGVTIYDEQIIPGMKDADPVAAKIPAKGINHSKKTIRDAVHQVFDAPGTDHTLRDIEAVNSLMQKILPTDAIPQVANLERATRYQAAATMQSIHARNRKLAKLIDDQCFSTSREMQYYNILQNVESVEIQDEQTGQTRPAAITEYQNFSIDALTSDSLKGVDKLLASEAMQDIIHMTLQSTDAMQRIDVLALIDYWMDINGDKTDFKQFSHQNEFDALTPEQKQVAFQLFQQVSAGREQEGGANVTPINAPGAANPGV